MNPLTTPEVLRLLEGGNESPLAKWNRQAAMYLASFVDGSICTIGTKTRDSISSRYFRDEINVGAKGTVTIPPEVVTRELGQVAHLREGGDMDREGDYQYFDRPAIVISTGDAS